LAALDAVYGAASPAAPPAVRYDLYILRGRALLVWGDPAGAQVALAAALVAAEALEPDGGERVARVYHLIGAAYAQQGLPDQARTLQERGWAAMAAGAMRDPALQLAVAQHLYSAYRAAGVGDRALATLHAALALPLAAGPDLESQSVAYGAVSARYAAEGDLVSAQR
jgi:hypothetical protein